jgi:hypothetical protein
MSSQFNLSMPTYCQSHQWRTGVLLKSLPEIQLYNPYSCEQANLTKKVSWYDLHCRLNHPGYQATLDYATAHNLTPSGTKASIKKCTTCAVTKFRLGSYLPSKTRATKFGERILMDLNIMPIESRWGNTVLLQVVDDFTGYLWSVPLHSKSDAATEALSIITKIFNYTKESIKIRTDQDMSYFDQPYYYCFYS